MDFYPTGCGSVAALSGAGWRRWPTAVVPFGGTVLLPAWPRAGALWRRIFASSQQKKSYGRDICFWRNCDSVQHDKNKVLLFPLKLIIKRVEFIAVNFIVFLQVVLFFFPSLFVLTWFLGGFSFCYLISRENILLFNLASCIRSMFWHGGACGPF